MNDEKLLDLKVQVELEDATPEELDQFTRQLRSEIGELDVDSVEFVKEGPAPEGTKGGGWAQIGQLLVTLAPTVIPPLFEFLKRRTQRKAITPLKIKIMVGERSLEAEYDPATISSEQVASLTDRLTRTFEK